MSAAATLEPTENFLDENWGRVLTLPDHRPIWEWAADIELPSAYAAPGPLDVSKAPFVKPVFESLANPSVREVVAMSGVQCLKTLIGEIWLLHTIAENPGPTQWLQTTDDDAKEHCEERFNALIEACPKVKAYFSENRHEKKIMSVIFKHMFLRMQGAENLRNLQRKSIKNQMRSEVWQWTQGRLSEADARTTQFVHTSKRYTESQAGIAGDDLDARFQLGDQNYWSWTCLSCSHVQPWKWTVHRQDGSRAGMRWEESPKTRRENGEWRWGELIQTVRMECLKCGHPHVDDTRTRHLLNSQGVYVPSNLDAPAQLKSFTWGQLTMENLSWFSQVQKFLLATEQARRGNEVPLIEFFQKVIPEPHDPSKLGILNKPQTCEINSEFPDEAHRWMTVDVQEDGFWVLIMGWKKNGDSRVFWLGFVKLWQDVAKQQELFKVYDGSVYIDCSWNTKEVYEQCVTHGHEEVVNGRKIWVSWRGLNGDDRRTFTYGKNKTSLFYSWPPSYGDPASGKSSQGRLCEYVHWSNPSIKDIAAKIRDGRGARLLVPDEFADEWTKHMYSERRIKVWDKFNQESWKWERIGKKPNHLWDCFCEQIVLATMAGIFGTAVPEQKTLAA